jgi:hypothetical protein
VSSKPRPVAPRCAQIRDRLPGFAANQLGPTAEGEVQGHLLDCQSCSEVFSEFLLEQVESGALPLLTSPIVPSSELYDRYLRARHGSTMWCAVRDALRDAGRRDWAATRIEEIRVGFELLTKPARRRGAVRTRSAATRRAVTPSPEPLRNRNLTDQVKFRGSQVNYNGPRPLGAGGPLEHVTADVLKPTGEPSGSVVAFEVRTPPEITGEGRFRFALSTNAADHDGQRVVCTIVLADTEPVSFEAIIAGREGHDEHAVVFDEHGLPGSGCRIPIDRVKLAIA